MPNVRQRTVSKAGDLIAKTQTTLDLERSIYNATKKQGVFGCFEVTIGWFSKERVDYLTYDTKGIWRCYEIKQSKSDFHSGAANTFIGHFNYYVMPQELYEQVKDEIPKHVGVYIGRACEKKPKRQELQIDEKILKDSMIRSLSREVDKKLRSGDLYEVEKLTSYLHKARSERDRYKRKYDELYWEDYEKLGREETKKLMY